MALSGTINGSVTNKSSYFSFYMTWSATQNIANNYSDVTVTTYWTTNNTYHTFDTVGSRNASITINGTTHNISKVFAVSWSSNPYLIQTATTRVYHDNDGTKSITISARANGHAASYGPSSSTATSGDCTASETITLDTIPRASSFGTITGNTIGSSMTVNITRNSSSFTHQLWYKLGNSAWYDLGKGIGTSKTFTISNDLLSQLPSNTSGTLQLCIRTYNGTTQIGSDVYKNVTVYVASTVVPTVGTITLTPQTYSILVQNKNTVTVSVSGCTAGTGSSIKSYTFSGPGLSKTITSTSATSGTVSNTGTLTYTVKVTDNRGRTASKTATISCYAWTAPTITLNAFRVASSTATTEDGGGTYARCAYNLKYSSVNSTNDVTVKLYYKKSSDSSWSSVTVLTDSKSTSGTKTLSSFDIGSTYTIYATITDNYGGSTSSNKVTIFSASRIMNIRPKGTGMAFGKMADTDNVLDSQWPIRTDDPATTMNNLSFRGKDVSGIEDTTASWCQQGNLNTFYYSAKNGYVTNQPDTAGFLVNITDHSQQVHQLWATQSRGNLYHRSGNTNDNSKIQDNPWRMVLDSTNTVDYIIDQGTSSYWLYEKWNSGVLKLYRNYGVSNVAITSAWGSLYSSPQITLPNFPTATGLVFTEVPQVNITWNGSFSAIMDGVTGTTTARCGYTYMFRPDSVTLEKGTIAIQAIGKWK